MMIRKYKTISEEDRYKFLLEYQVKSGDLFDNKSINSSEDDGVFDELSSFLDNNENDSEETEKSIEPIENKSNIDIDSTDNQTFEDTAEDLFKIHASKFENITNQINSVLEILDVLNNKTKDTLESIENINSQVASLDKRVEVLTPPTPLQSLDHMANITTGAQRLEDYWNEYFRKNGRNDIVDNIYYNSPEYKMNQKGDNNSIYRKNNIPETQIQQIIKSV